MAEFFRHQAGHGSCYRHNEAPFFVKTADRNDDAGEVVTLETRIYVAESAESDRNTII